MPSKLWWFMFVFSLNEVGGLLCYNCSATHRDRQNCGGDFSPALKPFYNDRDLLVNCTGDDAMCFVRSWSARARYAWIVQRGCYHSLKGDPIPRGMTTPTRAMACRHEKYSEAEYKVCFCQADWCNSATLSGSRKYFVSVVTALFIHIFSNYVYVQ